MDTSKSTPEYAPGAGPPSGEPAPGTGIGHGASSDEAGNGARPGTQPVTAPACAPPPPGTSDWAVCCSGGGIRSATYCLGGLQTLDEGGLLGQAKWIVGVSGGSYIAASRALVARGLAKDARQRRADDGQDLDDGQAHDKSSAAYARGTPEEQNLRNNTRYIAPDAKTVLVAVLSLLFGSVVTCLLVLAPLYAFAHAWGWLLHEQDVLTWSNGQATASVTALSWWLAPAIVAGVTVILFLYWWGTLGSGGPRRGARRARAVGWAAAVAAGLALLMLAVPPAIAWLSRSTGALGTVVHFFGFGVSVPRSLTALTGVAAAISTIAAALQKKLAAQHPAGSAGASAASSTTGKIVASVRAGLTPWLASLVVIAVGAFAILLWVGNASRAGFSRDQLVLVLVAVGVMLGTRAFADINRTSLHDFYRWRLADAYALTRDAVEAGTAVAREELFAEAARIRLSELGDDQRIRKALGDQPGPQLVIATTANINANREVPPGRGGFCLAFASDTVTLRADPSCGEPNVEAETIDYEHLLGHTRFTLFDVVAISGAAFSPLMGAATRGAYRIVLTLTNLRLGVWMPHPDVVRRARVYLDTPKAGRRKDRWWTRSTFLLLLWYVSKHPFWRADPARQQDREDRLWAHVLDLRERGALRPKGLRRNLLRLRATMCWRVMQPTLGMLWAEAVGHTSYRATWINVTDGGHYDNLGLVEALHRGAEKIVVFDASGDKANTWSTLGGAMALARTDAEVEIVLDPTTMIKENGEAIELRAGQVLRPWAQGTFTRLDSASTRHNGGQASQNGAGVGGQPAEQAIGRDATPAMQPGVPHGANGHRADHELPPPGELWVCKLGWWDTAPWDVRAYAAGHSSYPCDSTLQQLYDGAEFEAYHELGAAAVSAAAEAGKLPLPQPGKSQPGKLSLSRR
jgi:hypothetical protein